jgi:hypothetical protein
MSQDIDRLDIEACVARARKMRSEATGELIFAAARGVRSLLSALLGRLGRLFHAGPAAQH